MYLYKITNTVNGHVYIGITRTAINVRWKSHVYSARHNIKSALYDAMRSYGIDKFIIECIKEFDSEQDLLQAEKDTIAYYRQLHGKTYNILNGGASYFPIKDMEAHKANLRERRKGRKPALGKKHSDENKKLFSDVSKAYWATQDTFDEVEIAKLSFKEAHEQYGISKTHYYRLRNRVRNNESH